MLSYATMSRGHDDWVSYRYYAIDKEDSRLGK